MGVLAAKFKDTFIDFSAMSLATMGVSIPSFWLGILLIMLFTVKLGWFPSAGGTGWKDLVLPAVTSRDFPLVQGIILFIGFIFVLINILVDILYSFIDPRIEFSQAKEGT